MILDITPERIVAALIASRGAEPARVGGTGWNSKEESRGYSGLGERFDHSVGEHAGKLAELSIQLTAKGAGECLSYGWSKGGGSLDEECIARLALTLDLDLRTVRSDGTLGDEPITDALRAAGIAYVRQIRAGKIHLTIPFTRPESVVDLDADQKKHYSRVISFAIALFEALSCGPEFDHHEGLRLLNLVYPYTRRDENEEVSTTVSDGVGIDIARFVSSFPAELAAHVPPTSTRPRAPAVSPDVAALPPELAALLAPKTDRLTIEQTEIIVAFTAIKIGLRTGSAPRGHRHIQNLRDTLQLTRATLETAARDGLKIDRDTLTDAVLAWFQPRVDFQTAQGFDPARPPSRDIDLAVASAVEGAYGAGGKVAELASAERLRRVFAKDIAAINKQRMKLRTSCTIMPL